MEEKPSKQKQYVIYAHILKTDPTKLYIGQTCQKPSDRWDYGRGYNGCPKMREAIQQYTWDGFYHEIWYENLTKEEADALEISLIEEYKAAERGFNSSPGGHQLSDDSILKISNSLKEHYNLYGHPWNGRRHTEISKEKIRQSSLGRKASDITRLKLSAAHQGIKQSKEHIEKRMAMKRIPIQCLESGIIYNSAKECALAELGRDNSGIINSIRACARGERKTAGKKHFKYIEKEQ